MAGLYDDEWELVNDDGFVYKRKKRRLDPTHLLRHPDPAPDPVAEQRLREREKKKLKRKILLKLKHKYQSEIDLWEHLSNTLKAMEEQSVKDKEMMMGGSEQRQHLLQVSNEKCSGSSLVNLVLAQVEQQEAIIHGVSRLCDVAEALCDAQEEKTKQTLLDLPVWASPVQLMASLCED